MVIVLVFSVAVTVYLLIWGIHLCHFHSKFKQCSTAWSEAIARYDFVEGSVYRNATYMAHEDTKMAPLWPLVIKRWNIDYVAEARSGQLESERR